MTAVAAAPPDLPDWVLQLSRPELELLVENTPPQFRPMLLERLEGLEERTPAWEPLDHQIPPSGSDERYGWLLLGGRGSGKTAAVTHEMDRHAMGPPCLHGKVPHRMGIIAPTLGDASASIVHGDDGLTVINPAVQEVSRRGGTQVIWPNGAVAHLFGVSTKNDVDRLRAKGNRCFDLREEIAAWRWLKDGMAQADFGLRVGPNPRWIGATTPRPRPTIRLLNTSKLVNTVHATTDDNTHLPEHTRTRLYDAYGGTTVGLQELQGIILEDTSGALWTQEMIELDRVTVDEVPQIVRVRTYVDPSWGTTHDECGIVVMGLGINRHVYIFDDLSKRLPPGEWGVLAALGHLPLHSDPAVQAKMRAAAKPREWYGRLSERTVYETNFQGEQVRLVMKLVSRELNRRLLTSPVVASKGKRLRAEPVVAAYEQHKVHHVGYLPGLEFQQTTWVPPEVTDNGDDTGDPEPPPEGEEETEGASNWSPDRLDAAVFGVTDLLLGAGSGVGKLEVADGRIPRTTPAAAGTGNQGPRIGAIPVATRQGRLAAQQMKDKRHG